MVDKWWWGWGQCSGGGGWLLCRVIFCQPQLRLCSVELWLSWGFDKNENMFIFFFVSIIHFEEG